MATLASKQRLAVDNEQLHVSLNNMGEEEEGYDEPNITFGQYLYHARAMPCLLCCTIPHRYKASAQTIANKQCRLAQDWLGNALANVGFTHQYSCANNIHWHVIPSYCCVQVDQGHRVQLGHGQKDEGGPGHDRVVAHAGDAGARQAAIQTCLVKILVGCARQHSMHQPCLRVTERGLNLHRC